MWDDFKVYGCIYKCVYLYLNCKVRRIWSISLHGYIYIHINIYIYTYIYIYIYIWIFPIPYSILPIVYCLLLTIIQRLLAGNDGLSKTEDLFFDQMCVLTEEQFCCLGTMFVWLVSRNPWPGSRIRDPGHGFRLWTKLTWGGRAPMYVFQQTPHICLMFVFIFLQTSVFGKTIVCY